MDNDDAHAIARADYFAHRITDNDAHRIHGTRAQWHRFGLAWCARERAYHYIPAGVTERIRMGGSVRLSWPQGWRTSNVNQYARDVRTVAPAIGGYARDLLAYIGERTLPLHMVAPSARAFADAYDAQRTARA